MIPHMRAAERLRRGTDRWALSSLALRKGHDQAATSLPFRRVDDFIEAHEITDQRQMLAVSSLIRVSECAGHDVAEFGDVAYVNATYVQINEEPSPGLP